MAAVPIWQDKIITIPASSVLFRIYDWDNSVTLYQGVANARPGESSVKLRVNDICADYLVNSLPTLTDRTFTGLPVKRFGIQTKTGNQAWSPFEDVTFYDDWSYSYGTSPSDLSCPINGRVDDRMFILFSGKEMSSLSASYHRTSGSSTSRSVTLPTTPTTGTGAFKADAVSGVDRITIKSRVYYPVGSCYKYALYYVNAFGGWDQFLLEGNDMEVDEVVRYIREVEYDNTSIVNRGMDNYVNEVKKSWTLHSGLLTDDQASRMHHLINSPLVYLCHISSGDMIPVIMKTNTCEYKTFKNQGRRMVEYTLEVELAQNRIRR